MNRDDATQTPPAADTSPYCDHCGLPLVRCQALGGEAWHELWDETVDGLVDALRRRFADEEGEGEA